jgi:hypothetical protein
MNLLAAALLLTIPATTAPALDNHTVTLPPAAPATILILGFSHNSANTTTAWEKPIRTQLASATIDYYDIPFLEDAPAFIRPLILRSIRKQVPDILRPHFLPLTCNEPAWKQIVAYTPSAPDAAYVLLIDRTGAIRWQTHDPLTPARLNDLATAAQALAASTH